MLPPQSTKICVSAHLFEGKNQKTVRGECQEPSEEKDVRQGGEGLETRKHTEVEDSRPGGGHGDRKGCAMHRQGSQRKCHPVMMLGLFVCVFTMFCQGINSLYTSQPVSRVTRVTREKGLSQDV
eukprot:650652-Pelagomonas_calceolata.AAC.1